MRTAAVLAVLLGTAGVAVAAFDGELERLLRTPEPVVAPSFGIVAAALARHRRARRMGGLLAAVALFAGVYTAATALVLHGAGSSSPVHALAGWLTGWTWVPALGLIAVVLPAVVPDGRPLGGWWRRLPTASYAVVACGSVLAMVAPRRTTFDPDLPNPLGVPALDAVVAPMGLGLVALAVLLSLAGLVSLVVRARRATGVERRQVAWFGYGVAGTLVATALAPSEVRALAVLLVPGAVLVAATRYRLYDIDRLVNRTAVAAVLLAGGAVLYAAVAGWAAVVLGDGSSATSFAAAFAVALAFHPARIRVQRVVDRLLLPERLDPRQLELELADVARRAAGPAQALQDSVELLRRRLHAGAVAVHPAGASGRPALARAGTAVGATVGATVQVPLLQHDEVVGRLDLVARDAAGETLVHNPAVQAAVVGPLTAALHASALAADLESSRESIVAAREEERRRLRRELHDGLGPQLAAITMTLDTARRSLGTARLERADALLEAAVEQSRTAVEDVRAIVAGLRPPALDELGLEGALRSAGPGVLVDHDSSTRITIRGRGPLVGLPAATEVAAYRIAQEAMANAVRHAGADLVEVELLQDAEGLRLLVSDDGRGFDQQVAAPGVGLASMRERAAELGGSFSVSSSPGGGTRVEAVLPDRGADR
ncbi:sensor histidine kinase [uncultured Nocardioides sp.]|uniref:sensor histidine kinase n=1 Tax=uncultured Nocardioides sp. TaxID=198441 RepID=UPI0025F8F09D|nr:sensor histidine kinase [uncultured Nocardioides sp.]